MTTRSFAGPLRMGAGLGAGGRSATTGEAVAGFSGAAWRAGAGAVVTTVVDCGAGGFEATFTAFTGAGPDAGLVLVDRFTTGLDVADTVILRMANFFTGLGAVFRGGRCFRTTVFTAFFAVDLITPTFLAAPFFTAFFAAGVAFVRLDLLAEGFVAFALPVFFAEGVPVFLEALDFPVVRPFGALFFLAMDRA